MFAPKRLLFRLELHGRVIYEVYSDDVKSDITIGRNGDNSWIIPEEDRSASGRHARIVFKNKNFYIEDAGSRNGIYFRGERIREKKLSANDLFSIGDCKLIVEQVIAVAANTGESEFHKFEQLSGKNKGKIYRLTETCIKIGSSSGCAIMIEDSLVSHIHAVIENHNDGTCWIKDMKSRNGTKVNGFLLTEENAETGRMLKDGDVVSIAYIDLRFWDKNITHIRSHLALKIGIIVATLAIAIGGYFAFQTISPSAKKIRLNAEAYAARGEFETAHEILESAVTARGADADIEQRMEFSRKLKIWKNTLETWNKIQKLLSGNPEDGDLYEANELFSSLISSDREAWQWNASKASSEMQKAHETQKLLSILLGAEDWFSKSENDIAYLKRLRNNLQTAVTACKKNPQAYQNILLVRAADIANEMTAVENEYVNTLETINEYKSDAATTDIIKRIETIKLNAGVRIEKRKKAGKTYSETIIKMCDGLLTPLYKLQNSKKILNANYACVAEFNFDEFRGDILLPNSEECIVATTLSLRRAEMEKSNRRLKNLSVQLKNFRTYFHNHSLYPAVKSALLIDIFDEKIWNKVLDCDCLKLAQPSYSDKQWYSMYDKTLGVYVFWEYLRSVGGEFDTTIFEERFKPDLFSSREIFNHLEVFVSFCNPSSRLPFFGDINRLKKINDGNNKFVAHQNIAVNILKQRDALVIRMYEMYKRNPEKRNGIIAGGVALYLSPEKGDILPKDFSDKLSKSLKSLRKTLSSLTQQSGDIAPEKIIQNEKEILELGIPGDSFLKQPWTDHLNKKAGK